MMNALFLISAWSHDGEVVVRFCLVDELDEPAKWTTPRVMDVDQVLATVRAWIEEAVTRM
jgi:hypothetical protein